MTGDRGQAAGVEALPFGVLVFVTGTLIAVSAWGVVTARGLADSVAREYLRGYTRATSATQAGTEGRRLAAAVMAARSVEASRVTITEPTNFVACAPATVRVRIVVPLLRAPFVGDLTETAVEVERTDRVDPYRVGVPRGDQPGTPCG
jgi:hypothetical protein